MDKQFNRAGTVFLDFEEKCMKKHMQKHALSIAAAVTMFLGGGMQLYAADKIADTVYHNGKIYTIAETAQEAKDIANAKKADVVATLNGKIVFVRPV